MTQLLAPRSPLRVDSNDLRPTVQRGYASFIGSPLLMVEIKLGGTLVLLKPKLKPVYQFIGLSAVTKIRVKSPIEPLDLIGAT